MTDKEAMQMALDALDNVYITSNEAFHTQTVKTLSTALAQPEPEPVAIVQQEAYGRGQVFWAQPASTFQDGTPLYTAPPQREQAPPAWHHPDCEGNCMACLIEREVQTSFGNHGLDYLRRHVATPPQLNQPLFDLNKAAEDMGEPL